VHWAPGFPCALCLLRDSFLAKLGRYLRRENAESHLEFHVIASEAKQSIPPCKERMDCFASLAMTQVVPRSDKVVGYAFRLRSSSYGRQVG
jgi:hypothetical protein